MLGESYLALKGQHGIISFCLETLALGFMKLGWWFGVRLDEVISVWYSHTITGMDLLCCLVLCVPPRLDKRLDQGNREHRTELRCVERIPGISDLLRSCDPDEKLHLHPALRTGLVSCFLVPVLSSALPANADSHLEEQAPQRFSFQ